MQCQEHSLQASKQAQHRQGAEQPDCAQLGQYAAACTEVFPLCNKALCESRTFDCSMSGSTGILAILQNNKKVSNLRDVWLE